MRLRLLKILICLIVLPGPIAGASSKSMEVGLELPLNLGLHGLFRINDLFHTRVGVGFISKYFMRTFTKIAPHMGYVNDSEADLISDLLENSLYFDMRLGFSPYVQNFDGGPYIEIGFSSMMLGGGHLKGLARVKTSGFKMNKVLGIGDFQDYYVKTNTYNGTLHIGYKIPFEDNLKISLDVGVLKIFKAQITTDTSELGETINLEHRGKLQKFLVQKGLVFPTVSAWVSFMF